MELIDLKRLKRDGWAEIGSYTGSMRLLVSELGKSLKEDFDMEKSVLTPKSESGNFKITLSGSFGFDSFPYHTDGAQYQIPPRYIILKSLGNGESKAATLLVDPISIFKDHKKSFTVNDDVYWVKGGKNSFYTTLLNKTIISGLFIFRYNPVVMKKLNLGSKENFSDQLGLLKPRRVLWKKNKTLIIDNWRLLHGREKVNNDEVKIRKLERTYLFYRKYNE